MNSPAITIIHRAVHMLCFVALALPLGACENSARSAGANGKPMAIAKPSIRPKLDTVRALLPEVARAELSVGGLLIDLGTADQHKYTLGGWKNGWGENKLAKGTTYSQALSKSVPIKVLVHETHVAEIVARLRVPSASRVGIMIDGKEAGNGAVGTDWTEIRVALKDGLKPGWHDVRLLFTGTRGAGGLRGEVDWLWMSHAAGRAAPVIGPRTFSAALGGRAKRAIAAPTPRAYAFYLQAPKNSSLVVDYGASAATQFIVRATTDDGSTETLWSANAAVGEWNEARIDLGAIAGRAARLELVTESTSTQAVRAGWGEPELMVEKRNTPRIDRGKTAKNVIVILMDTARYDMFAAFAPKNKIKTPTFDQIASESTAFVHAYDNENWTKPSVASLLTSLYPSTHGTKTDGAILNDSVEMLPERLKKNGFATAAFIANGYCSERFGFRQGWDFYTNYIHEERNSDAETVFPEAMKWLKETTAKPNQRFFLYVQTIDAHVTYHAREGFTDLYFPEPYAGPFGPNLDGKEQAAVSQRKLTATATDVAYFKALYHGEISYHDHHMGKFFDELTTMGLLADTLLVITNDHGEELGERGRFGHGHTLHDELIRSPLIFRFPGIFSAGARIEDHIAEAVDVLPTILDVLGLSPDSNAEGLSLLPLLEERPEMMPTYAVSEFMEDQRSVRVGRYKLVASSGTSRKLFDLQSDPHEMTEQHNKLPIAHRLTEVYLGEGLATPQKSMRRKDATTKKRFAPGQVKWNPKLIKQLEKLGYFGDRSVEEDTKDKQ